jgi:LmbE family N-acetylglucosaminyl deacetylase
MLPNCTRNARVLLLALLTALPLATLAHAHPRPAEPLDAAGMRSALARLHVTGSVLYVAAHPDDENTAMLAWFSGGRKVRTAYLAMTRGDGGQNLIGTELGADLGVIRTQELMAARRVDGAEQMFTRALDFGFSKNPEETFAFWGRDSVLADVVWAIRRYQPDVIITRFPTDGSGGHGHHTASAILAEEAFDVAADPKAFPQQFALGVKPWRAKRLFWNAWNPDDNKVPADWLKVDVGPYDPVLGKSFGEIAALSRSNHKSQGFGVAERHGALPNYLALRKGDAATTDLFDGVDLTWARAKGGDRVDAAISAAEKAYDPAHPQALLPQLFAIREAIQAAPAGDAAWWRAKRAEIDELIRSAAGLWVEAIATRPTVTPGDSLPVVVTVFDRFALGASIARVRAGDAEHADVGAVGATRSDTLMVHIVRTAPLTQPYWLRESASKGLFTVRDRARIGLPENPPSVSATVTLKLPGGLLTMELPVSYRWADPVQGERWRALEIAPPATLQLDQGVYAFTDRSPRPMEVRVQAQRPGVKGRLRLDLPPGWTAAPAGADVALAKAGDETHVSFMVTPGEGPAAASVTASIMVDGTAWSQRLERIDYPHIPMQTLFPPASARLVRADIRHTGSKVAYIMGPGDAIPGALQQMGYDVTFLSDDDLEHADLSRFDAIMTGVRAYNTRPRLRATQPRLLDYVKQGGTLLMQYNTTADGPLGDLGPYPFQISRDRVTVEEAPIGLLKADHPVLHTPNAIGPADFDGWVQERGLYFANPYDPRYDALFSSHDPGEPARDGGLLYTKYGKGVFEYCAYAMFRQVPAGVPGAWRLLANLLSQRGAPAVP